MKKFFVMIVLLLGIICSGFSTVSASENTITRGEFFNLIVEHMGYENMDREIALPADIPATSPYAEAAKILKAKKIVAGYEDGTFKPEQKITAEEASNVIARLLVIKGDALEAIAEEYGLDFNKNDELTLEQAKELIATTLRSDESALNILDKTIDAQNNVTSYQANVTMSMNIAMSEEVSDIPNMEGDFGFDFKNTMTYHKDQGIYQHLTTSFPDPITNELQDMKIDQYIVPEGFFMLMEDPMTGEEQWLDMSAWMPFSFEEIVQMNEDNMKIVNDINKQYFFYKNLGTEELYGTNQYKLAFSGKIGSFQEMLNILSSALPTQSDALLSNLESMPDMDMEMTGVMWIDEETLLPTKQQVDYVITYGSAQDAEMEMPMDEIDFTMNFDFYNYNEVEEIALPEEAKNAEKLPSFEEMEEDADFVE